MKVNGMARDPRKDPQRGDILKNSLGMVNVMERGYKFFGVMDTSLDCVIYRTSKSCDDLWNWGEKSITLMDCWETHERVIGSEVVCWNAIEGEGGE